jgi:succinate dehydrogenase / fumarate reductase cytochrome b subunit
MYALQRFTGLIALCYIGYHVWSQRFHGVSLPEHPGAAFHKVQAELSHPLILAVYVLAMIATTWHFAYGIWLFAAKWGITPGTTARKRFGYVCGAFGTILCVMGLISIYAVVYKYPNAPADVMPAQPAGVVLPAPVAAPPDSTNTTSSDLQK